MDTQTSRKYPLTLPIAFLAMLGVISVVQKEVQFPVQPAVEAQGLGQSTTQIYEPFAFENLAISSTAVGFTAATYAPGNGINARKARCTVNADDIRYRVDGGSNPSPTVGHLIDVGVQVPPTFELFGGEIKLFRAIRVLTDATASCTFYR